MTATRVLLVNPRMCSPRSVRLPLSLLALGAVLEGRHDFDIVDGNLEDDAVSTVLDRLGDDQPSALAVTVMPGPQVAPAIAISAAVRARRPEVPIVWGGYFPTLYPDSAVNAPYVDFVVRGQGEDTLLELLERLPDAGPPQAVDEPDRVTSVADPGAIADVAGLSWKRRGAVVHNPDREPRPPETYPPYPYQRLGDVETYLRPSFMGSRTGVHQAAVGCRFRCRFCGVVSMFDGYTRLPPASRLDGALRVLADTYGANGMQYYDNNFFDREDETATLLEVMARHQLPWWCYARADALAGYSTRTWELIAASRLKMAYIGAEAASDAVLRGMRKGARVDHTLEAADRCRAHGVIPEFSFVLGGPDDPEGEIERTFEFIKRLKRVHPTCEIVLYFYSPTPQRSTAAVAADRDGVRLPTLESYGPDGPALPTTPEEWTEPRWIDYVCHRDAPWLEPELRQRVKDFAKVVYARFPTVLDTTTPAWGKTVLRALASWRYASGRYGRAWELNMARRLIPLREPPAESV